MTTATHRRETMQDVAEAAYGVWLAAYGRVNRGICNICDVPDYINAEGYCGYCVNLYKIA